MYFPFYPLITAVFIVVVIGVTLGLCAYFILIERKIAAWTQDRIGPNRVGPFGLLQPIADGVKFLLKEDVIPDHVDKLFFLLAPAIALSTAMFAIVVVPFGPTAAPPTRPWPQTAQQEDAADKANPEFAKQVAEYNASTQYVIAPHVDIGFLLVFAVGSLAVYGIILGGWSSNSKYSFLGALRSSAQIISYEIPLGMSALAVVLITGSLNLERIIGYQVQNSGWLIVYQPLAFLLFLTSVFAECNRLPFDLPEAEQELVGGYHTEYSAMKFALFFLGEYAHMITTSFLVVILFLGGWHLPGLVQGDSYAVLKVVIICGKMLLFILFSMFIRWTLPRFRFDQLMGLAWKVFIPLALLNILAVMIVRQVGGSSPLALIWLLPISVVLLVGAGLTALYRPAQARRTITVQRGHERVEMKV
jgi:NADH-quinone oxidoreductase subunit H